MAWLRRSSGEPEPAVLHDQVMKLLNLMVRMSDADEQEVSMAEPGDKTPPFDQAKAALAAEKRRSTKAGIRAASEAARRHGYV